MSNQSSRPPSGTTHNQPADSSRASVPSKPTPVSVQPPGGEKGK